MLFFVEEIKKRAEYNMVRNREGISNRSRNVGRVFIFVCLEGS